jgi:hypothetical protein
VRLAVGSDVTPETSARHRGAAATDRVDGDARRPHRAAASATRHGDRDDARLAAPADVTSCATAALLLTMTTGSAEPPARMGCSSYMPCRRR